LATIYLIRHGETEWNVSRRVMGRTDVPLNEKGEAQAAALARAMKKLKVDAVTPAHNCARGKPLLPWRLTISFQ